MKKKGRDWFRVFDKVLSFLISLMVCVRDVIYVCSLLYSQLCFR